MASLLPLLEEKEKGAKLPKSTGYFLQHIFNRKQTSNCVRYFTKSRTILKDEQMDEICHFFCNKSHPPLEALKIVSLL